MTIPFTAASQAGASSKSGKSVQERVSERKSKKVDEIRTGAMIEALKERTT